MPELHPDVRPIAFLLGRWEGEGHGDYPTIDPFDYKEMIEFSTGGKPFIAYRQQTWSLDDGRPLHAESGYLRPGTNSSWEWVLAQPSGFVEVHTGDRDGSALAFQTLEVLATPTAKSVAEIHRTLRVEGDVLTYVLEMAAVGHPMQQHLAAMLRRVAD